MCIISLKNSTIPINFSKELRDQNKNIDTSNEKYSFISHYNTNKHPMKKYFIHYLKLKINNLKLHETKFIEN